MCCACGNLQHNQGNCQACGHDELVAVFRTTGTRSRTRGNVTITWHDNTCPACGQRDRRVLLGARNATLGAQVVAESPARTACSSSGMDTSTSTTAIWWSRGPRAIS